MSLIKKNSVHERAPWRTRPLAISPERPKTEPNRSCSTRARPSSLMRRGGAKHGDGKKTAKMPSKSGTCCRINSSYTHQHTGTPTRTLHTLHMCEREGWSKRPAIMSIHSQKQGYKANSCGRPSVSVCVCLCTLLKHSPSV